MKTALLLLALVPFSMAATGLDAIDPISVATFQCLKNNGYSFYIARVWEQVGNYDFQGMQNIKNAWAAGFAHVDGYVFPCHRSGCAQPANQIEATINRLRSEGVNIGQLWLDIEVNDWPGDHNANRQFITAMANQAVSMGVALGVYTNPNNWGQIVGNDWGDMGRYSLWWANWNNQENFNGFTQFGGWTHPAIRQYSGDVQGPCGVAMDKNWYA